MKKSFKNIDDEIRHHITMAAYHSNEATQLLKKKGDVSTPPARKGRQRASQASIDAILAKIDQMGR